MTKEKEEELHPGTVRNPVPIKERLASIKAKHNATDDKEEKQK